jgi:L-aspartate oxidase
MDDVDVLVIGSGLAGCTAALTAARAGKNVLIATNTDQLLGGSTRYAQGGIVYTGEGDSAQQLVEDILTAGDGHSYEPAARLLAEEGPGLVKSLLIDDLGVPFSKAEGGAYHRTAEAAHAVARILHSTDQTGLAIAETVTRAVQAHPRIQVRTGLTGLELLTTTHHSTALHHTYENPRCFGARFFNLNNEEVEAVVSPHTILATGGLGQLFLHTTNPVEARGGGIAMAWRAGARCVNLHYVQFHPTALFHRSGRFLISEAVRGEGGRLVDENGVEFMTRFHPDGALAPRDVVARGIYQTMLDHDIPCAWLDVTHKDPQWLKERFPSIHQRCLELDIDITRDRIPVVPAAHYACGGVLVDLNGKSTVDNLYAVGEVSCSGVHGANRLASTSLLECLVWGHRAARAVAEDTRSAEIPEFKSWVSPDEYMDPALIAQDWLTIRNIMWNYVGLIRTPRRLHRARQMLRRLQLEIEDFYKRTRLSQGIIGLRHGIQTALAVTLSASEAHVSRGSHYIQQEEPEGQSPDISL